MDPINASELIKRCRVCGDQAICFSFDVLTCAACRLFFHRNFHRSEKLTCRNNGNCEVSLKNRRSCIKCRMVKGIAIGMKLKQQQNSNNNNLLNQNIEFALRSLLPAGILSSDDKSKIISLPKSVDKNYFEINQTELKYIDELLQSSSSIFNFEEVNLPVLYIASNIYQVLNLSMNYVRRIIKFCKSNSVFRSLNSSEQVQVLKQFVHKLLIIRNAFSYDAQIGGFYALGSEDGNCSVLSKCAVFYRSNDQTVKELVEIKRKHTIAVNEEMENDKTIRDLLIVQAMFDFDEKISVTESLRYQYWIYNSLLLRYLQCKYKNMNKAQYKHSMLIKVTKESMNRNKLNHFQQALQTLDRNQFDELNLEIFNIPL